MKSPQDGLDDYREKIGRFQSDDLNESLAMDCAVAGWTVLDWVFQVEGERLGFKELTNFQNFVRNQCPEMGYIQDIANARKHKSITRYTPRVKRSKTRHGGFGAGFSRGFDISRLVFETEDGEFDFQDTLVAALVYLDELFIAHAIS